MSKPALSKTEKPHRFFLTKLGTGALIAAVILLVGLEIIVWQKTFSLYHSSNQTLRALLLQPAGRLAKKESSVPLGLSAALAAGNQTIRFFWTQNQDNTQFYRLYHGIASKTYRESYDSPNFASNLDFDYSQLSLGPHYFALSAVGLNGVESTTSDELMIDLSRLNQCNNGLVEPGAGETCDGNSRTCGDINGYRGVQDCVTTGDMACKAWGTCQAAESCGDDIVNGLEICDGDGAFPCTSGLYSGTAPCQLTGASACQALGTCNINGQACGDGQITGGEQCEGNTTTACTVDGLTGTKTCTACLWSACTVVGASCGSNQGKNLLDLNQADTGNCRNSIVTNFNYNASASRWDWKCKAGSQEYACWANKKADGICGSAINSAHQSAPTSDLCQSGNSSAVNYDSTTHKFKWTCAGANGGTNVNCAAPKCGDAYVLSPEQCDFGTNNNDNSGCSGECRWGNYQYSCPALSGGPGNIYNTVSAYGIPCQGPNGASTACGSWAAYPPKDPTTEYNTEASSNSCRFKCSSLYGKCGSDPACDTYLIDSNNCGACGTHCQANQDCVEGGSIACACLVTHKDCNGQASDGCEINITNDSNNCGTCGTTCGASQVCSNGVCACALGWDKCGGSACLDLQHNANNCGACGKNCQQGSNGSQGYCNNGACDCNVGFTWDGSKCIPSGPTCGNGVVDPGEQCDPVFGVSGNVSGGICNANTCKIESLVNCPNKVNPGAYSNLANTYYNCPQYYQICEVAQHSGSTYSCQTWGATAVPVFNFYLSPYGGTCTLGRNCEYNCLNNPSDTYGNCHQVGLDLDTCESDLNNDSQHCGSCSNDCGVHTCNNGICNTCGDNVIDYGGGEQCDKGSSGGLISGSGSTKYYCDSGCKIYKEVSTGCTDPSYRSYSSFYLYYTPNSALWSHSDFSCSTGVFLRYFCQNFLGENCTVWNSSPELNVSGPQYRPNPSSCPLGECDFDCQKNKSGSSYLYGNCDNNVLNLCETELFNDPNNCGACGTKCGLGYGCNSGVCEKCGDGLVQTAAGEQCESGKGSLPAGQTCQACKIHKNVSCSNAAGSDYRTYFSPTYSNWDSFNFTCANTFNIVCRTISSPGNCSVWNYDNVLPPPEDSNKCLSERCSYICKPGYCNFNKLDPDTCETTNCKIKP